MASHFSYYSFHILFGKLQLPKNITIILGACGDPEPDPTRLVNPNRNPGDARLILLFYILLSFFSKESRPKSLTRPEGRVRIGARFTPTFSFILSKHLFMSFRFKVFNYAEVFSNGRPINIYISQKTITIKAFYAFLK